MHNNIMAAGLRDPPPMLATGRYAQWQSRFLRYIDTRPNGDALRKGILEGPYKLTTVIIPVVPVTNDSPEVPERTAVETLLNMSPENKEHYQSEKEAIHLLLLIVGLNYSMLMLARQSSDMWIAIESTTTGFYKMMNEMIRNNLTVATMQVNVQFLQQLQPEWSRFVTIVKQNHDLDTVSYHKLFDVLKQYQKEVNEIRAERKAKNANPLALVVIAKPITPPSESASEEDSDPEQAQGDKDMQKNLALIAKTMTVAGAKETVGSQVVQQTGIQCFNCKEFGHFAKECRKPKRVKDYTYHKEKMLFCKQAEKGVPLQAEQADWLEDTDEEIDEQELEAHYSYMEKI
ncbi:retrovirus-related pol polyprotein from transposon TNT 1-94 [Tanacetum coccineum]